MPRTVPAALSAALLAVGLLGLPAPAAAAPTAVSVPSTTSDRVGVMVTQVGDAVAGTTVATDVVLVGTAAVTVSGEFELTLTSSGGTALQLSGDGWSCDAAAGRCTTTTALAPGAELPPVRAVHAVRADRAPTGTVDVRAVVLLDGSLDRGGSGGLVAPVLPRSLADLAVSLSTRPDPVRGRAQVADAVVRNVGSEPWTGVVTVRLTALTAPRGTGWTCTGAVCTRVGPPVEPGAALPALTAELPVPQDADSLSPRSSVALVDARDGYAGDDTASTVLPAVSPGYDGLELALAPSGAGTGDAAFALVVRDVGDDRTAGRVEVRFSRQVEVVEGTSPGWACAGDTCRRADSPAPGGDPAPELVVRTPGSSGRVPLSATLVGTDGPAPEVQAESAAAPPVGTGTGLVALVPVVSGLAPARAGEAVRAQVRVANRGLAPSSGTTTVDLGRSVSASGEGWTCADGTCTTAAAIAAGGRSAPLQVEVLATPDLSGASTYLRVSVSGGGDPSTVDGTLLAGTRTGAHPVLLVPVVSPGPPAADGPGTAEVTVANAGWRASSGRVYVQLEQQTGDASATRADGDGWTCSYDLACSHEGPVPAEGRLPSLRVVLGPQPWSDPRAVALSAVRSGGGGWSTVANERTETDVVVGVTGPALALDLTAPSQPYRDGSPGTARLRVRDVGDVAHPGPVTVSLDTNERGLQTAGAGDGWWCRGSRPLLCTHAGGTGRGTALPDLLLTSTTARAEVLTAVGLTASVVGNRFTPDEDDGLGTPFADTTTRAASRTWPVAVDPAAGALALVEPAGPQVAADDGSARVETYVVNTSDAPVGGAVVEFSATPGARVTGGSDALWACDGARCTATGPIGARDRSTVHAGLVVDDPGLAEVAVTRTVRWTTPVAGRTSSTTTWRVPYRGPSLTPVVTADRAGTDGTASFRVTVHDVGGTASTGTTRVLLTARGASGVVTASGEGWTCPRGALACTTTQTAGVDGVLPDVRVQVPSAQAREQGDRYLFPSEVELAAVVENAGDGAPEDDRASSTVPGLSTGSALALSASAGPTRAGPVADALVVVHEAGTATSTRPVHLDLQVPATTTVPADPAWACAWTLPEQLSCSSPALAPGASRTLRLQHPAAAPFALQAVTRGDVPGTSSSARTGASGLPAPEPTVAVRAPEPVAAGDDLVFGVDVRGTGGAGGPVRLDLELDDRSSVSRAASGTGWSCDDEACSHPGPLVAGQALPALTVTVPGMYLPAGEHSLAASTAGGGRAHASTTSVERPSDLSVLVSSDQVRRAHGRALSTVVVTSVGRSAAPGPVELSVSSGPEGGFDLPVRGRGDGWSCDEATCRSAGPVAAGESLPPLVLDADVPTDALGPTTDLLEVRLGTADVPDDDEGRPANGWTSLRLPVLPGPERVVPRVLRVEPGSTGARAATVVRFSSEVLESPVRLLDARGAAVPVQRLCADAARTCPDPATEVRLVPVTPLVDGATYRVVVPPGSAVEAYEGTPFTYSAAAGPFALTRYDGTGVPSPSPSPDRFSTARETALRTFPAGAETVVLARGDAFADALAGSTLAGSLDAPVLLTATGVLPADTARALGELGTRRVVVLGGTAAVSDGVVADLRARGLSVRRLSGDDRYETAAAVTRAVDRQAHPVGRVDGLRTALLGSGERFPDVLAAAGPGFGRGLPVLVTRPDSLPPSTAALLRDLAVEQVVVVGGAGSVSDAVAAQAAAITGRPVQRVFGDDRFATAAALAAYSWDRLGFDRTAVHLARGDAFADALAAGPASGRDGAPLVLVTPEGLPEATAQLLVARCSALRAGRVLGGSGAVPGTVVQAATSAVRDCRVPR